jgi:Tol biopolymer transport system component
LSYDIFSGDGQPVISDIPGESSGSGGQNQNQNQYRSGPIYTTTAPVAAWSANGSTLTFLQTNPADNRDNLIALNLPTKHYETIARDVVGDLAKEMLNNAFPFRRQPFFRATGTTAGSRLVLPTWHNGKIDIELADLDGSNRTTLVQGADEVLDPRPTLTGYASRFWLSNGRMVAILWTALGADGTRHVHLTWADSDGSNKHDIDDGWESINQLQFAQGKDQRWLGYIAQRDGQFSIELMDIESGASHRLLGGLTNAEQWALALAPVGDRAAVQLGASASRFFGESTLTLVSLDGTWARQVSAQANGPASWSPDGSKLAFLYRESGSSTLHAQAVTAIGTLVHDVPILHANSSSPRLYRWSKCG